MMKSKLLLSFLALLLTSFSYSQFVNIPDLNFKSLLVNNSAINTSGDGEISFAEASAYSGYLNISNANIANLTGLEAFTAIIELNCSNNQLTSLNVSANTQLWYLKCDYNQIVDLSLTSNTLLEYLKCDNNQLVSLNVSANPQLNFINCETNLLSSLDVSSNPLLTNLSFLYNQVSSINLSSNTLLTNLYTSDNLLSTLDLTANTALEVLICGGAQMTSLDVSVNTALRELDFTGSAIQTIDLTNNINLTGINSAYGSLQGLNVSQNPLLTDLNTSYNPLMVLDLSNNPALVHLACSFTSISNLDLSANPNITTLYCDGNSLTSLDLSTQAGLTLIECNNNNLATLNVQNGNNSNVSSFNASANPNLSCIQVDDITYSNQNWTNIDPTSAFGTSCLCTQFITGYIKDNGQHPSFTANDTLQISLFQKTTADSTIWPMVDSFLITLPNDSAFFSFANINEGTYMLKAKFLSPVAGQNYMPTFSGDSILWYTADSIVITPCDSTPYIINIQNPYFPLGTNSLGGYLYFSDFVFQKTHSNNDPIPLIDVVIERDSLPNNFRPFTATNPVTITSHPAYLSYSFTNLPVGNYRISIGIPGINQADTFIINLAGTNPNDTLNFCIDTLGLGLIDTCFLDSLPDFPVGINPHKQLQLLTIYPNPSSGVLKINSQLEESTEISIFNILGKLSFSASLGKGQTNLSLSLPNGLYYLHTSQGEIYKVIIYK